VTAKVCRLRWFLLSARVVPARRLQSEPASLGDQLRKARENTVGWNGREINRLVGQRRGTQRTNATRNNAPRARFPAAASRRKAHVRPLNPPLNVGPAMWGEATATYKRFSEDTQAQRYNNVRWIPVSRILALPARRQTILKIGGSIRQTSSTFETRGENTDRLYIRRSRSQPTSVKQIDCSVSTHAYELGFQGCPSAPSVRCVYLEGTCLEPMPPLLACRHAYSQVRKCCVDRHFQTLWTQTHSRDNLMSGTQRSGQHQKSTMRLWPSLESKHHFLRIN